MTTAAAPSISSATTMSIVRVETRRGPSGPSPSLMSFDPARRCEGAGRATGPFPARLGLREEAGFLHQVVMRLLGRSDPFREFVATHEGLVEGAILHELLPLRRLAHLLEQIHVER